MPAFAAITGNDYHSGAPVAHTLSPLSIDSNGVAHYVEAGATPLDDIKASLSKRITAENGRIKCVFKISWPITATETINGIASPKVLRTAYAELTLTADASSSAAERYDILELMRNMCGLADQPWVLFGTNGGIY